MKRTNHKAEKLFVFGMSALIVITLLFIIFNVHASLQKYSAGKAFHKEIVDYNWLQAGLSCERDNQCVSGKCGCSTFSNPQHVVCCSGNEGGACQPQREIPQCGYGLECSCGALQQCVHGVCTLSMIPESNTCSTDQMCAQFAVCPGDKYICVAVNSGEDDVESHCEVTDNNGIVHKGTSLGGRTCTTFVAR